MAKLETFGITFTSAGFQVIVNPDSTMTAERITCSIVNSLTDHSFGSSDSVNNYTYNKTYNDKNQTHTITHYRNKSGVKTKTFEAKVPTGGFSVVGDIDFNVTTCTENTRVEFAVHGV